MKILSTQDYSLFKRIGGNRTVSPAHVNRLKEAMEEDPETITYNPIIVNGNWEVIDGQHRLEAMQALELPVYFIKVDDLSLTNVQKLNSVAKVWTPIDYAKSFRELGNENYKVYLDFKREFGFNHEILLRYMALDRPITHQMFKEGKFKVSDVATAYKYCTYLQDLAEEYPRAILRKAGWGFLLIVKNPAYNHDHFVKQVRKFASRISEQSKPVEYAREFERIYNLSVRGEITRLF